MIPLVRWVAHTIGRPISFLLGSVAVLVWALTGPYFQFSSTWQLIINTGTTVFTFLMMFVLQNSQNQDTRAIHLKLDELIKKLDGPSDKVAGIENSDQDLDRSA